MASIGWIRDKGQLTIPDEIRKAARLKPGDPVEIELVDGVLVLTPKKLIDASQAWFWTAEWQAGEAEASADIAAGRVTSHDGDEDFLAALGE